MKNKIKAMRTLVTWNYAEGRTYAFAYYPDLPVGRRWVVIAILGAKK